MEAVITCLVQQHDRRLLVAAFVICVIGVYASFALAKHAARCEGIVRRRWGCVSVVAAGCTAWATHMIALLAYEPGIPAAFDLVLTALSLLLVTAGIGLSITRIIASRDRRSRFVSGILLGLSVTTLHYLGQLSYRITGTISWEFPLAISSAGGSLLMFGIAMVAAAERNRMLRRLAPPLLLGAIAVVHVGGMTAMATLIYDPQIDLPTYSAAPEVIAPVVASICLGLIALAALGLRFTLHAQAQLRRDQTRLSELSNLAVEGLVVCDGETITIVNDSFARLAGVGKNDLVGQTIRSVIPSVSLSEMTEREEYETEFVGGTGKLIPVRVLRSEVSVGKRRQTVVAFRDQRDRLESEKTIRRLAYSDSLTGLTNRARFTEILTLHAAQAGTEERSFSLLAIDLDRFKWVNDTFGHTVGDELLRQVADRLRAAACADDVIARLGGDEFVILTTGGDDGTIDLASNIVHSMQDPFTLEGQTVEIGASIGIAQSKSGNLDEDSLSRSADLALYHAKRSGGGRYCVFEPQMLIKARARSDLERDLRLALQRDELEVHYQPQVDVRTGAFEGAEALARWKHPELGAIAPAIFIPVAEEIGLIGEIGERVLRIACAEAVEWPEETSLAVNLSAVQLADPNLVLEIVGVLEDTGFPPQRLELEVTESALLRDDMRTFRNLHGLRNIGVRVSLDDFGTGYSSLSHLRRFPFDKVKIDRSFVRQIPDNPDSVAIVQAIFTLASKLRMSVTIEGVETPEQQAFALSEGCDQMQGFLISRPVPAYELDAFLTSSGQRNWLDDQPYPDIGCIPPARAV